MLNSGRASRAKLNGGGACCMDSLHNYHPHRPNGYSAKNFLKPVPFTCHAPQAQEVFIMGDFNEWHPASCPLSRMPDGAWRTEVSLCHGHHHYLFVIDGTPTLDPHAQGIARNEWDEEVSLVAVS